MTVVDIVRFGAFTAVKIQVEVFWVVMLCSVVVGYQRFTGPTSSPVLQNVGLLCGIITQKTSTWMVDIVWHTG